MPEETCPHCERRYTRRMGFLEGVAYMGLIVLVLVILAQNGMLGR